MADIRHNVASVRVGDTYNVNAIRLNDDGDGVVIVDGFTVFIPNFLVSESATIAIDSVHRRFARGRIIKRDNDSANRVTPPCPVFGICGGCQLQHLDYSAGLLHKEQMVAHALRQLPQSEPPIILPMIGMNYPYRYRNQVQVPVEWDDTTGRLRYGFFARDSHTIVETPTCHLETLTMEQTVSAIVDSLAALGGEIGKLVHHIIVRESYTSKEQMVILSVERDHSLLSRHLATFRQIHNAQSQSVPIIGVGLTEQPNSSGPVWGQRVKMVDGGDTIRESILNVEFLISPRSFFQVNTEQAVRLYETVRCFADLHPTDRVLDAYCGIGSIALVLARSAGSVSGIETISAAVDDAKKNAVHNHIENAQFHLGEVEKVLPRLLEKGQGFDVIVLDPPRKGVHPDVIRAVLNAKAQRLIYVSCNPATLGRDAALLVAGGYRVDRVQPVDMFPQTSHVECVVSTHRVDK